MSKIKIWIKEYLKAFRFKEIGIIFGLVTIFIFGFIILGDLIEELNLGYTILYNICTYIALFTLPILYVVYVVVVVAKYKKISLAKLNAIFTISIVWINSIGISISYLVSSNNWMIKQDRTKFLNGIEYMLVVLFNDIELSTLTVLIVIGTLIIRLIKKVKNGKKR